MNVHVYPSPLTHESRIIRITSALVDGGVFDEVQVIGVLRSGLRQVEHIDKHRSLVRLPRRVAIKGFLSKVVATIEWSVRVLLYLRDKKVECINAHSLAVLPLCAIASMLKRAKLVYDTHELETETSGSFGIRKRIAKLVERIFIQRCDKVFVVSDSIAKWYTETYAIDMPTVIRNIPDASENKISRRSELRLRLLIAEDCPLFIYQGGFIEGRGLERMLQVFRALPESNLLCMGQGPLENLVVAAVAECPNIHLVPPVPPNEVLEYTRAADVGVCLTDKSCLSHDFSLPNKVFEYLHAGLPIIVNLLTEQRALVQRYKCGWIAPENDEQLASLIDSIDRQTILNLSSNVEHASADLTWEKEKERLLNAYKNPLGGLANA